MSYESRYSYGQAQENPVGDVLTSVLLTLAIVGGAWYALRGRGGRQGPARAPAAVEVPELPLPPTYEPAPVEPPATAAVKLPRLRKPIVEALKAAGIVPSDFKPKDVRVRVVGKQPEDGSELCEVRVKGDGRLYRFVVDAQRTTAQQLFS